MFWPRLATNLLLNPEVGEGEENINPLLPKVSK